MKNTFKKVLASMLAAVMVLCAAPLSGIADIDWGSLFAFKASALDEPAFELVKVGESGNKVTVAVNLISGSFNAMDFQFSTSSGVKCESISAAGGYGNKNSGMVSLASVDGYTGGTVITATFTVPSEGDYSISGSVTDCAVLDDGVNKSVNATVTGSVLRIPEITKVGDNVYGYFDSSTGTLTISGTGDMYDYDWKSSPFYNIFSIKSVVIEDGVTSVGDCIFGDCDSLTSVTIPNSVTSIGNYAFEGCTGLTSVNISDIAAWCNISFYNYSSNPLYYAYNLYLNGELVTDLVIPDSVTSIGNYAFEGCTGLTSITIPDSVTSIGADAFFYCIGLTSVTIPDSVTSIGQFAFSSCSSLTSVTIPNSVTSIGDYAFYDCINLTSISIPDNVTSIGDYAFCDCTNLTSATIPDSVTSIGSGVFRDCISLTSISIPDGVTSIGADAFFYCIGLTSVTIPDSVTSIGQFAFSSCSSLTSVTIPDSVTSIDDGAFGNCTGLTSVTIPDSVTSIGEHTFYECTGLTSVTIPDSVTSIGNYAFCNCSSLTSVTIPASVTSIGSSAFKNCTNISEVYFGGSKSQWEAISNNSGLLNYKIHYYFIESGQCGENVYWTLDESTGLLTISGTGNMYDYDWGVSPFCDNSSIKNVVIEDGITSIGSWLFYYCENTESIFIPDSVLNIGDGAFAGCLSLKNISLPENITSIDATTFSECTSLTSITIPDCVTNISDRAFQYCTGLKNITLPDKLKNIGEEAFLYCSNITSITIPESVTSIGNGAFSSCSKLMGIYITDITSWCNINFSNEDSHPFYYEYNLYLNGELVTDLVIPDGITKIGNIFQCCTSLTSITIPDSVLSINHYAFEQCINLTDIYYRDSQSQWNNITHGYIDLPSDDTYGRLATIHYFLKEHGQCGENVYWTFDESTGLLTISGTGDMYDYDWNKSPFYSNSSIKSVVIEDDVTSVGSYAFFSCEELTSVTLPDSVTSIGEQAFAGCRSLSTVNYNATYCESASFSDLRNSLTDFVIGNNVKYLPPSLLNNCDGLTTLTIPASVEKIGSKTIAECDNLQTVIFESDEYIEMDSSVFLNSPNVMILCKENSYMHYYADMENLKYCIIDNSNNPNFTVKNDILVSYNGEAENVFLSSASKIGFEAFKGNTDIKSVELANNVTRIYNSAFKNCTGLEKIIIPKSVASIGDSAFTGCDNLTIWCYAGSYAEAYAVNHDIPLQYITLSLSDNSITVADSEEITLDASFSTSMVDSGEIIWASSNPEIATVENGRVNVLDAGEAEITATTASGLSASCEIRVDLKLDSAADAVIDNESGIVFGSDMVNKDADGIKNLFLNSRISVTDTDGAVGTGDKVSLLKADGSVYREIDIVIFGDVNGDGWYDGTDSIIVNCLANGLLSKEQVGEAVYMAADCNHDDVIDENDVALLEQVGLILAGVDQSKTADELMTDSAYVEYLNLIDQNPTQEAPVEETPTEPADEEISQSFLQKLIAFISYIIETIFRLIPDIF